MRELLCTTCGATIVDITGTQPLVICPKCGYKLRAQDCDAFKKRSADLQFREGKTFNVLECRKKTRAALLNPQYRNMPGVSVCLDLLRKWIVGDYRATLYSAMYNRARNVNAYLSVLANTQRGMLTSSELQEVLPVIVANCDTLDIYREAQLFVRRLLPERPARIWVYRLGKAFKAANPVDLSRLTLNPELRALYQNDNDIVDHGMAPMRSILDEPMSSLPYESNTMGGYDAPMGYAQPATTPYNQGDMDGYYQSEAPLYVTPQYSTPAYTAPTYTPPTAEPQAQPVVQEPETDITSGLFSTTTLDDSNAMFDAVRRPQAQPPKVMPKISAKQPAYGEVLRRSTESDNARDLYGKAEDFVVDNGLVLDFLGANKSVICLPETVTQLDITSFADVADKLERLFINAELTNVEDGTWATYMALQEIIVSPGNAYFKSIDKILYDKSGDTLLYYPDCTRATGFKIPSGVKRIENGALTGSANLQALFMPDSVSVIGEDNLHDIDGLKLLRLSGGLTEIPRGSLSHLNSLKLLTIPEHVQIIRAGAICDNGMLEEISLPASLARIEGGTFRNLPSLKRIFLRAPLPPTLESSDLLQYDVYVPEEYLDAYTEAWAGNSSKLFPMKY